MALGINDGPCEGARETDGLKDGRFEGWALLATTAAVVGTLLSDGVEDGRFEGCRLTDGLDEGESEGSSEGMSLGASDMLGWSLGAAESPLGVMLGIEDGESEGAFEGTSLGASDMLGWSLGAAESPLGAILGIDEGLGMTISRLWYSTTALIASVFTLLR
jgi:hypothetical protein